LAGSIAAAGSTTGEVSPDPDAIGQLRGGKILDRAMLGRLAAMFTRNASGGQRIALGFFSASLPPSTLLRIPSTSGT